MATGTLIAYATPSIVALGIGDHTYVLSSAGHVWSCGGGTQGGNEVCQGTGNVDQAQCLSQVNSLAGINPHEYGRVGVCHQRANRILMTAGVDVDKARLGRKSTFLYGKYGKDLATGRRYDPVLNPWPELATC